MLEAEPQDEREAREAMVREQIEARGIRDPRVLAAMRAVPRHLFVPVEHRANAYADRPLPIGEGQTISQPLMVAVTSRLLDLTGSERVLDVGTGSGYQAAVLSLLAREVISVERIAPLERTARTRLEALGFGNVSVHLGDASALAADLGPFDAVLVAAAAPDIPAHLLDALVPTGRLVAPVGSRHSQTLALVRRSPDGRVRTEWHDRCTFVPMLGIDGWASP